MNFNQYQEFTRETAIYPRENPVLYLTLGLNGEAGEVADKVKKRLRDGISTVPTASLVAELGDVLWYLARLADELGVDLSQVAALNKLKLTDRMARSVLSGSGDNR